MFTQNSLQAGTQVPKGTVESGEEVLDAAVRECIEETGIQSLPPPVFLARDEWQRPDGRVEQRFFYHFSCSNLPEHWTHSPSGGGAETGLVFRFQWLRMIMRHSYSSQVMVITCGCSRRVFRNERLMSTRTLNDARNKHECRYYINNWDDQV